EELLLGGQDRRVRPLGPHRTILRAGALPPFGHGLRVDAVAFTQRLDRSFRSLYSRSDGVSSRGASVEYLSHSISLSVGLMVSPSHHGTKHLMGAWCSSRAME